MTAILLKRAPRVEDLLKDAPEFVTPSWVAEKFGLTVAAVNSAIRAGKLPAQPVGSGGNGKPRVHLVRPEYAVLVWGYRLLDENNA